VCIVCVVLRNKRAGDDDDDDADADRNSYVDSNYFADEEADEAADAAAPAIDTVYGSVSHIIEDPCTSLSYDCRLPTPTRLLLVCV
jgi:hypothetical protein